MKTIFTKFAAASLMLAAVACQNEDMLGGGAQNGTSVELVPLTISATLESDQTKTSLQEGGKVYWENGDAMTVLAVADDGAVTSYKFTTTDEGAEATFTNADQVALAENYYAVYPYTATETHKYMFADYKSWVTTVEDSKLKVHMPSLQRASVSGSEGLDAFSVGKVAKDGTVIMKNLGGLVKVNIPVADIESIILYGNNDETIVGNAYVTFGEDGLPTISSVIGDNTVRVVPASGDTFAVGDYYINVLPVTFTDGLTVIFTKSDDTWASLRSSGEFVVERSKISSLPEISSLTFDGKVVNVIAVNDAGGASYPFTKGLPSSSSNDYEGVESSYILKNSELTFKFKGTKRHYRTNKAGLCYGQGIGDYVEFPAIEGYALNKIVIRNSADAKESGTPAICDINNVEIEGTRTWDIPAKVFGLEHTWSFAGAENTPYRITRTTNSTDYVSAQQIRLYYVAAPEGVSSVKPLITSVTTAEPETDPTNGKATLNGSFTAVDCNSSAVTCGFDYKLVSEQEWTTVACSQATSEFSYELIASSSEDYVYRAWTKVNATGKTVYGSEVQFNPCKLVLHLVFDENRYETGYNYAWDTWKIATNANTATENLNGAIYNYTYEGVDYPFTFWSYRPSDTEGGYSLWVASGTKKVYGLSLSYTTGLADSQPAWMLMPGPKGFKLVEVDATLSNANFKGFGGTISVSVNEDGTASGDPVATYTGKSSFPLSLEGTEAGKPYYFCTTHNNRPTLKDLTLTYLYVGE